MIRITLQKMTTDKMIPSLKMLRRWIRAAENMTQMSIPKTQRHLTIRIIDSEESYSLNNTYRKKPKPTNVLAFEEQALPGVEKESLGDIALCAPIIAHEADLQNKLMASHWAHLTIHGFLHLLGYNHEKKEDTSMMETLETNILNVLGYENPYEEE